ncbi:MAG: hypothetical protein M1347_01715 [Chloroflexi bacterium]|nr:hypothetical protein [Chloroflexota bacterium]
MDAFFEDLGLIRASGQLALSSRRLGLIIGADFGSEPLHGLIAYLAVSGYVNVIDGGNNFDLIQVAYSIRSVTQDLYSAADRIKIVRAFTCIEVLKALEAQPTGTSLVVINMLATFYDEAVTDRRIMSLMEKCLIEINRLKEFSPVLISVRDDCSPSSPRAGLLQALIKVSDSVYDTTSRNTEPHQKGLF